jgi:hypothetical protein|tara:strand:- start:1246 stop:1542 length:297 start_codon:yes stop_codon:yes gene_type:complete
MKRKTETRENCAVGGRNLRVRNDFRKENLCEKKQEKSMEKTSKQKLIPYRGVLQDASKKIRENGQKSSALFSEGVFVATKQIPKIILHSTITSRTCPF